MIRASNISQIESAFRVGQPKAKVMHEAIAARAVAPESSADRLRLLLVESADNWTSAKGAASKIGNQKACALVKTAKTKKIRATLA